MSLRASHRRRGARLSASGDVLLVPTHDARLPMEPVRTCVGCRQRGYRSVLLRVVVAEAGGLQSAVPDPDRRSGGRGASLHFSLACLDAAERRRAFPRALRHEGPLDTAALRAFLVAVHCSDAGNLPADEMSASTVRAGSGSEADEHPMSKQR